MVRVCWEFGLGETQSEGDVAAEALDEGPVQLGDLDDGVLGQRDLVGTDDGDGVAGGIAGEGADIVGAIGGGDNELLPAFDAGDLVPVNDEGFGCVVGLDGELALAEGFDFAGDLVAVAHVDDVGFGADVIGAAREGKEEKEANGNKTGAGGGEEARRIAGHWHIPLRAGDRMDAIAEWVKRDGKSHGVDCSSYPSRLHLSVLAVTRPVSSRSYE